ncbi:hypothetical protein KZX37_05035 [Microbacterium sp. EYE_5]|uniref:hypothetical protein n=1 Tax=unclassified Microbacterium TaxID=2609290 RepID=UPI002005C6E6|nr:MULTISPECIES: hypothetical protein [unclassified Microbacterium]MCK6079985.1 hypothetical protein [Microbacterium sp. EYE_382]MCK6085256.1 hypothetical protein [Microbacterium sp. EYE_384]MCK6122519.1 hypothetical protein [Microbacterium sp. EYE_80]MCK6126019.1 hypothetical protein [Microbacterium sp. EYE_79]MCK6140940.1 hypothetical protein [Microbacterium sp. EYE_39]
MSADPVHQLTLEALAPGAWRLCNSRVSRADAANLLAYVEEAADGGYDVTWVHGGSGTAWFPTVDELLLGGARHLAACASRRGKPKPIAHRPPLAAL